MGPRPYVEFSLWRLQHAVAYLSQCALVTLLPSRGQVTHSGVCAVTQRAPWFGTPNQAQPFWVELSLCLLGAHCAVPCAGHSLRQRPTKAFSAARVAAPALRGNVMPFQLAALAPDHGIRGELCRPLLAQLLEVCKALAPLVAARDSIPLSPSHCSTVALNLLGKPPLGDLAACKGLPGSLASSHVLSTPAWTVCAS
eukprot:5208420-Amphidinium_carterae.3